MSESTVSSSNDAPELHVHSRLGTIGLIAMREVKERTRSRIFRLGTFMTMLIVVAAVVLPAFANGKPVIKHFTVGMVAPYAPELAKAIEESGHSLGGIVSVQSFADETAGDDALRADSIAMLVVPGQKIVTHIQIDPNVPGDVPALSSSVSDATRLFAGLEKVGLSATDTYAALHAEPLPVGGLEPAVHRNSKDASSSSTGMILLFVFLTLYGAFILNGVIEEKTSRVVEILLSTVRPSELLIGKVLGIGAVGTIQGLVLVIATFAARASTPAGTASTLTPVVLAYTLLWFLIGFGIYAGMYACAGALVSRSEDAQNLVFPLQLPLIASYITGLLASFQGPNAVLNAMSFIPFTAPMTMLERMAAQQVSLWEILLSIAICLVSMVLIMRLATVIFAGGILRSGQRVKLRDAWRNPAS